MDYTRPELTETDIIQCRMDAAAIRRAAGPAKSEIIMTALVIENVRLVKEINEHRAARGIAPLEVKRVADMLKPKTG
jgi:phosphopantetheine adenylyltransferase